MTEFDPAWLTCADPTEILPEAVVHLFRAQELIDDEVGDKKTLRWVVALTFGRTLYATNAHDNWHVMPCPKGVAGTGKSRIIAMLEDWFGPFVFSPANRAGDFALQGIEESLVLLAPDLSPKQPIDKADWCKIISGETTALSRKFQGNGQLAPATMPCVVSFNEIPHTFLDPGMLRRMVLIPFTRKPKPSDFPNFENELKAAAPVTLVLAARLYRDLADRYGNFGEEVQKQFPRVLLSERDSAEDQSSVGRRFVYDMFAENVLATHADVYIPQKELESIWTNWRSQQQNPSLPNRFPADEVRQVLLQDFEVQTERRRRSRKPYPAPCIRSYTPHVESACWFLGIDICANVMFVSAACNAP